MWISALAALTAAACGSDTMPSRPPPMGAAGTTGTGAGNTGTGPGGGAVVPGPGTGTGAVTPGGGMMLPMPTVGAQGVELVRAEINQGVAIVLAKNGMPTKKGKHAPPVVGGRGALVRGYWKLAGAPSGAVLGLLTVTYPDGMMRQFRDMKMVAKPKKGLDSGSVARDGAFNWKLEPADVRTGMELVMELYDGAAAPGAPAMPAPRLPAMGTFKLNVDDAPAELHVVVLPITLAGSSPAAGPENVKALTDFLYDIYPVQKVNIDVRPAQEIRGLQAAAADKTAFKDHYFPAMEAICRKDKAKPGVLYQGILDRSKTGMTHGGTARGRGTTWTTPCNKISFNLGGYSYTPSSGFAAGKKIDYPNAIDAKADSVAHEYGHLYGRPHIDCGGPSGPDPAYPYMNGSLGQQGYRVRADTFMHKNGFHDFMGYCRLRWISDWSLKTLHPVLKMVTKMVGSPAPELESDLRTLVGYAAVNRFHEADHWLEVDGDATEPIGFAPDSYAQVWVDGYVSPRIPVTALADEEGDVERVSFVLPPGVRTPERAVVVHRGVRVQINPSMVESL